MNMDRYAAAESFYKLAMAFAPVPDLHIMWLLHLCDAHQEMQSWAEAAQCAVAVAGVVMQVACGYMALDLNVLKRMFQMLTVVAFQRNRRCSYLQKMEGFHFPILPHLYALILGKTEYHMKRTNEEDIASISSRSQLGLTLRTKSNCSVFSFFPSFILSFIIFAFVELLFVNLFIECCQTLKVCFCFKLGK